MVHPHLHHFFLAQKYKLNLLVPDVFFQMIELSRGFPAVAGLAMIPYSPSINIFLNSDLGIRIYGHT